MYIDKFKAWGITKQYKAAESDRLALEIVKALHNGKSLDQVTHRGRPVNLRKILRHMSRAGRTDSVFQEARRRLANMTRTRISTSASVSTENSPPEDSTDHTPTHSTPDSGHGSMTDATLTSPGPGVISSSIARLHIIGPSNVMTSSPGTLNLEIVLHHIRTFLNMDGVHVDPDLWPSTSSLLTTTHRPTSLRFCLPYEHSSQFFENVKSAFYFLKTDSPQLAWPLLQRSCEETSRLEFEPDWCFLVDLLSSLSPARTKLHPELQRSLLQFLIRLCTVKLRPSHPLTAICRQLLLSDSSTSDLYIQALSYLNNHYTQLRISSPNPIAKVQRALARLVRQDSQLNAAERLTRPAIEYCKSVFGEQDQRTEQAKMELVYVYTYQGEYDKGLDLCTDVLRSKRIRLGPAFPDSKASYVMENMAELHHFKGNISESTYWLRRALASAWRIRGGVASTVHVREKLEALLVATGRLEESSQLKDIYPADVEEMCHEII